MKFKNRLAEAFRLYFILVTLITVLLMIVGLIFDSDKRFGYEVFLSPLLYAAISVIPSFFINTARELSMKKLIIRHLLQLFVIEIMMLAIAFTSNNIPSEKKGLIIGLVIGIAAIYVLSLVIEYIFELTQSKELNAALEKYQKEYNE